MYFDVSKNIEKVDNYVLISIRNHVQNKCLDSIMPVITFMGNLGIVWIVIGVVLMLQKPYKAIGSVIFLTLIISTIIGEGIVKHIVKRVRPCNKQESIKLLISKPITYSFPSGHTLSSFAVAEMLSMYFTRYKLMFMAIAFLIALSRLYLYVHYPTDVIAGIIIGVLCSKTIFILMQKGYIEKFVAVFQKIIWRG